MRAIDPPLRAGAGDVVLCMERCGTALVAAPRRSPASAIGPRPSSAPGGAAPGGAPAPRVARRIVRVRLGATCVGRHRAGLYPPPDSLWEHARHQRGMDAAPDLLLCAGGDVRVGEAIDGQHGAVRVREAGRGRVVLAKKPLFTFWR